MSSVASKFHKPILKPISVEEELTDYLKVCPHCKTVYQSPYANARHCILCASCGENKRFMDIKGKARYIGYICKECYLQKPFVRKYSYNILLRF
jgi:hypothetical protein